MRHVEMMEDAISASTPESRGSPKVEPLARDDVAGGPMSAKTRREKEEEHINEMLFQMRKHGATCHAGA